MEIRDISGKLIDANQFSHSEKVSFDINAPSGIYLLTVKNDKGTDSGIEVKHVFHLFQRMISSLSGTIAILKSKVIGIYKRLTNSDSSDHGGF